MKVGFRLANLGSGRKRRCRAALCVKCAVLLGAVISNPAQAAREKQTVDLQLLLAVDVSSSMSKSEQQVQRKGYVNAFRDPDIVRAIATGKTGKIAVSYAEWSGPKHQHFVVPWTIISSYEEAREFAAALESQPITAGTGTSISGMLRTSHEWFNHEYFLSQRRVIDVSGDGINNIGPPLAEARDQLLADGITINGLPISLERTSHDSFAAYNGHYLEAYHEDCIIGGPNSFVMTVNHISQFDAAIRAKLLLEIAARPATVHRASYRPRRHIVDCSTVGESPGR